MRIDRRRILKAAIAGTVLTAPAIIIPQARAQTNPNVLQTVTAWSSFGGPSLPASTGQILDQASAQAVISANLSAAPGQGLTVNSDGSITHPASGITILQGYVVAAPFYDVPLHPLCGGTPPSPKVVAPQTWGAGTLKIFSIGQSHATNAGRFRATSRGLGSWQGCYAAGQYYQMSDPVPFADGADGSIWPHFADAAIGALLPDGSNCNRVLVGGYPRGGASVVDFMSGGAYSSAMVSEMVSFLSANGQPTFIHICQGPADVGMPAATWVGNWLSVIGLLRGVGCTAPIMVDTDTICNFRDDTTPAPNTASNRTALDLITIEINRQTMRSAQATLASYNQNFRAGANLDLIDWHLRAYCDGCHFGELGMVAHAEILAASI